MARPNGKDDSTDLKEIRHEVEVELRRLTRHRLHNAAEGRSAILQLTRAGVLKQRFAELLRRIIVGRGSSARLASDALAILRIVPNHPS